MDLTLNGRLLVYLDFIVETAFRIPGGFASLSAATCWFTKSNAHTKQAEHRKATQTSQRLNRQQAHKVKESVHEDTTTCDMRVFPIISRSVLWQVWHQGCSVRDVLSNQGGSNSQVLPCLPWPLIAPKAGYVAEHSAYHHGSLDSNITNHDLNGDKVLSLLWWVATFDLLISYLCYRCSTSHLILFPGVFFWRWSLLVLCWVEKATVKAVSGWNKNDFSKLPFFTAKPKSPKSA